MAEFLKFHKFASALDDIVHAELTPGEFGRVLLREHLKRIVVNDHAIAIATDGTWVNAVHAIVFEEVGQMRRVGEIIDGDHVKVSTHLGNPSHDASNTPETVNGDFGNRHDIPPWVLGV